MLPAILSFVFMGVGLALMLLAFSVTLKFVKWATGSAIWEDD